MIQRTSIATATLGATLLLQSAQAETLLTDFGNNFYFDAMYASWLPQEGLVGGPTDWTIIATDFGGAAVGFYEDDGFTPKIVDASTDEFVEFTLTILATNVMGPQLLLEDEDGTRLRYSWYGLPAGTHTLVNALSAGAVDLGTATGSIAGLDLSKLVLFHVQMDDGAGANSYTLTLENLRTTPAPPPPCESLVSDFDNRSVAGGYASWAGGSLPPPQPNNWTITSSGFGGGFQSITPQLDASGDPVLELQITITNTPGSVIPIIVFQDADGTQNTWAFGDLVNGSYVLTQPMTAGNPVASQPGTIPGLDTSKLAWFHLQIDPGTNTFQYTAIWENLNITGFNPEIVDFSYTAAANDFGLIWNSRPGRSYDIGYVSDLTGDFSILSSNIMSGGLLTTNTVSLPEGDTGFVQISEQCQ